MNQFKVFQEALEKTYSSLTVFSDMNWDDISREYIAAHDERPDDLDDFIFNFPQFLQDKASEGDCPSYMFELAYFELLQNQILATEMVLPTESGLHLNQSLSFLNLEFDINLMMEEAAKGSVQVFERPHVLCIYRHPQLGLHHVEISSGILEILQLLEKGSLSSRKKISSDKLKILEEMIELGLVIEVTA